MRRIYDIKLSATGWMRAQVLRSRKDMFTAAEVHELIKNAEQREKDSIMIAYSSGADDVYDCETYGYNRRSSYEYYTQCYKGGKV